MTLPKNIALKVCGMRDPKNIADVVNEIHPEYLGFIFFDQSARYVGSDFELQDPGSIKRVGVFVNEPVQELLTLMKLHHLDFAQLHGDESPEEVRSLATMGVRVIKAIHVSEEIEFELLKAYEPHVEYFLFDTSSKGYGGSGRTFNWELLTNYPLDTPYFLSGGLSPENIALIEFSKLNGLIGIDVNSGFESEPAVKDVKKLKEISREI